MHRRLGIPGCLRFVAVLAGAALPSFSALKADDTSAVPSQVVFERTDQVLMDRAEEDVREGRLEEAITLLQRLLDREEDGFVRVGDPPRLAGLRNAVESLLARSGPKVLEAYRDQVGADARVALEDAVRADSEPDVRSVFRRYFYTESGYAAGAWLVSRALDQGRFEEAAQLTLRLVSSRAHARRISASLIGRGALAFELAGRHTDAERMVERLLPRLRAAGREVVPAEWLSRIRRRVDGKPSPSVVLGDVRSSGPSAVPWREPAWSRRFAEAGSAASALALEWLEERRAAREAPLLPHNVLVAENRCLVRDHHGLTAFDTRSGDRLWRFSTSFSLETVLEEYGNQDPRRGLRPLDELYRQTFAENGPQGVLSCDGERVYLLDASRPQNTGRGDRDPFRRRPFRRKPPRFHLVALPLTGEGRQSVQRPAWFTGGVDELVAEFQRLNVDDDPQLSREELGDDAAFRELDTDGDGRVAVLEARAAAEAFGLRSEWEDHGFLGAPLCLEGVLYAISEHDGQYELSAIAPASGERLWRQVLGFADAANVHRSGAPPPACLPVYGDGILVCPMPEGLVVGVDLHRRSLAWAADLSSDEGGRSKEPPASVLPVVADGRAVFVSPETSEVRAVELGTGRRLWSTRHHGARYVAGNDESRVLVVVGDRGCAGLSPESGELLWASRPGRPAGRGLLEGERFVLPLAKGGTATLNLRTGRVSGGSATDRSSPMLGNLVATSDGVLSVTVAGVARFPRLADVGRQLAAADVRTPRQTLDLAEIELRLDRGEEATARLAELAAGGDGPVPDRARRLLREALYAKLAASAEPAAVFEELRPLVSDGDGLVRYLARRGEYEAGAGDFEAFLQTARELLAARPAGGLLEPAGPDLRVSVPTWVRTTIAPLVASEDRAVRERVLRMLEEALDSGRIPAMEEALTLFGSVPAANAVRLRLAERYAALGRDHEAELLLLRVRRDGRVEQAARATRALLESWSRRGANLEAARLVLELEAEYADVPVEGDVTGKKYAAAFAARGRTDATVAASSMLRRPEPPVRGARIDQDLWSGAHDSVADVMETFRRRVHVPAHSSFLLLERGASNGAELAVVDRQSGALAGSVGLKLPNSYSPSGLAMREGHFLSVGGLGRVDAVSLLRVDSGKPTWTYRATTAGTQRELFRVGPAGPSFCSFQTRDRVLVLDPADGSLLWERVGLERNSGVYSDPFTGFFGDERALVVFGPDRSSYTVLETVTGRVVRRGELGADEDLPRRSFGRRLFYVERVDGQRRARIWDPLEDRLLFDTPVGRRLLYTDTDDDELALVLPDGRLLLLDVATMERRFEVPLDQDEVEGAHLIRLFSDEDRYYVNLHRTNREAVRAERQELFVAQGLLPKAHVQGRLLAVDKRSGKRAWTRDLPQRSFLLSPYERLPVLVAGSRIRERRDGERQSNLIEVFDASTGETLAVRDDLVPDQYLTTQWDPKSRRLLLKGTRTQVVVQLRAYDVGGDVGGR